MFSWHQGIDVIWTIFSNIKMINYKYLLYTYHFICGRLFLIQSCEYETSDIYFSLETITRKKKLCLKLQMWRIETFAHSLLWEMDKILKKFQIPSHFLFLGFL